MQQNSVYQICGYVYDNHYFHNKLELYIFLWDQAEKLTREAKEKIVFQKEGIIIPIEVKASGFMIQMHLPVNVIPGIKVEKGLPRIGQREYYDVNRGG